ncbi:MAG: hypothetical protein ACMUIE_06165 [Thermoplasmatota archaeon]
MNEVERHASPGSIAKAHQGSNIILLRFNGIGHRRKGGIAGSTLGIRVEMMRISPEGYS